MVRKVLVDTHTFLWAITDVSRLSATARSTLDGAETWFSVVSIWEVIVKVRTGKLSLPQPVGPFLTSQLAASNVQILAVTLNHVLRVEHLEPHHRDPFDRMLVAQSIEEGLPILTADRLFEKYPVKTMW